MTKFWTVAVGAEPLPQAGDPVEVVRSETGRGYVAWSHGLPMPVEAVVEYGTARGRPVGPEEVCGTIGLISPRRGRLAVMRID